MDYRIQLDSKQREFLGRLAARYIWWKTPEEALAVPERIIAQVMDIGDYTDVQEMACLLGDDLLRQVLTRSETGQFSERSWVYWHYRLGLAEVECVPPMPRRKIG